jgi:penicillin-insensitive murein endopeptidase
MLRPMTAWLISGGIVVGAILFALEVAGEQRRGSVSIGTPNDGKLWAGAQLPKKGRGFYANPARPNATATWGTDEMISALIKAGADLDERAPGATMYINDIGFFEGGRISHHHSHQAGRDADILFFMLDDQDEVAPPVCIPFDGEGKAIWNNGTPAKVDDDQGRRFDTHRNWHVVRSLLENQEAHVQRIYISDPLRELMLGYAREQDEPAWVIERADEVMCQPSSPHDDHFHVRLFCTAEDYGRGCRDTWPIYPWRRTQLAVKGLFEPKLNRPRRRRRRASKEPHPAPVNNDRRLWCP